MASHQRILNERFLYVLCTCFTIGFHSCHKASSVAFSDILGMATHGPSFSPASELFQGPSRDLRNRWIFQTALSTERRMSIARAHTKCHTRSLRRIKASSSSVVSATPQTGTLHCITYSTLSLQLTSFKHQNAYVTRRRKRKRP